MSGRHAAPELAPLRDAAQLAAWRVTNVLLVAVVVLLLLALVELAGSAQ